MTTAQNSPAFRYGVLEINKLRPAPWNARKVIDEASLAELVQSIREHGIQVPLTVRSLDQDLFQIVCGHRRYCAAVNAGLKELPVLICELGDQEAQQVGLVDNLQREDLPAIDEAEAFQELQRSLGSVSAVAAAVGKEVGYVTKRLQLCLLGPTTRKALADRLVTVDHALLLSRLGLQEQDANLKWALDPQAGAKKPLEEVLAAAVKSRNRKADSWARYWEPQSVLELRRHIEQNVGRRLSLAPWALDSGDLVEGAAACNACPSNTRANDSLFGDMNIAAATCEDGVCFERKREAFVQIRLEAANQKQRDAAWKSESVVSSDCLALRLSWRSTTVKPRETKEGALNFTQLFRYGQWIDAKAKSCPHVRFGVTVDWDEPDGHSGSKLRKPGEILTVCIEPTCKVHRKSYAKQPGSNGDAESYEARQKREREAEQAFAAAETPVRRALYDAIVAKLTPAGMLRRVLLNGSNETVLLARGIEIENWEERRKRAQQIVGSAKDTELPRLLFDSKFGGKLRAESYERNRGDKGRETLRELAKVAGVDAAAIERAFDKPKPAPAEKKPAKPAKAKKPVLSAAARARIVAAQKKRFAAAKKTTAGKRGKR